MSKSKHTYEGLRYPPLNELIDKVHNKYELVLAASKRARELVDGAIPLINYDSENPISIATEEIDEGKINLENPILDKMEEEAAVAEEVNSELSESTEMSVVNQEDTESSDNLEVESLTNETAETDNPVATENITEELDTKPEQEDNSDKTDEIEVSEETNEVE